jgi:hypothetical protein
VARVALLEVFVDTLLSWRAKVADSVGDASLKSLCLDFSEQLQGVGSGFFSSLLEISYEGSEFARASRTLRVFRKGTGLNPFTDGIARQSCLA